MKSKTDPRTGIDEKSFWAKFFETYWERKPVVYRNVSALSEIDADHIFDLLLRYSDYCRKTKTVRGLKLYIDGQSQYIDEVLQLLPLKTDKSLQGYHRRMNEMFDDYCLVCDELAEVSQEKWSLIGEFMEELYRAIGMPNRYTEIGLYLGNYRKTPFGVHVDGCGVLSFPVVGLKKFRIWEANFVKRNPALREAHEYAKYKKSSKLLSVKPGDIAYWPSSAWHIAESDGSFSATWSFGIWVDRPFHDVFTKALGPVIKTALGVDAEISAIEFDELAEADGQICVLPEIFNRSIKAVRELTEVELRDAAVKYWLEVASKRGFKSAPVADLKSKLKRTARIKGKTKNPIFWAILSSGEGVIAVNGLLVSLGKSPASLSVIRSLNRGETCKVLNQPPLVKSILETIYQNHGVEVV